MKKYDKSKIRADIIWHLERGFTKQYVLARLAIDYLNAEVLYEEVKAEFLGKQE